MDSASGAGGGVTAPLQFWSSWQATAAPACRFLEGAGASPSFARHLIQADCTLYAPLVSTLLPDSPSAQAVFLLDPSTDSASEALAAMDRSPSTVDRLSWIVAASPRDTARLHMCSGWGAGAALLGAPTELLLQLPDQVFRMNVCLRLGISLAPPQLCQAPIVPAVGLPHVCGKPLEGGEHVFCCLKTMGTRTRWIHNPLVTEFGHILTSAGHHVRAEQRDPSMGANARLDLVEYPSEAGAAAAYDVTVVTALRASPAFLRLASSTPGHAAVIRHDYKLSQQYIGRLPGARLVPLVAEVGGRWHPQVHRLLLIWSREAGLRNPQWGDAAAPLLRRRWCRRFSANIVRGSAQVLLESLPGPLPDLDPPSRMFLKPSACPIASRMGHRLMNSSLVTKARPREIR